MYMHISLIIVSIFYVEVGESISCFNCVGTSNDTQSGQASTCGYLDANGGATCDGDFCLVTTLYYDDYFNAPPITIVWRQCGKSASLPSGVNTGQCTENSAAFNQMLYLDRYSLCCYRLKYDPDQMQHHSNVTYCFCTSDNCNDLKYRTNFTFATNPTQPPGVSPTSMLTQPPGVSPTSSNKPVSAVTDITLSGILVSVYVIPIASTAAVSVLMILMAVCLWRMS